MICEKDKCTGCFGCFNICPKDAISMEEDAFGNVYPTIDEHKCINCGLCKSVCPVLNSKNIKFNVPKKVYAMYSKNNNIRTESTSGGIATTISKYVIEKKGVVYGAGNILNNGMFEFIRINSVEDLFKIQGSKYVHCYINKAFKSIKKDLEGNKMVLFIATPCQVAGLKNYLNKKYDNLITMDIICHGVPSQKILFEDLYNSFKLAPKDFEYITFRDSFGYHLKIYKTIDDYKEKKSSYSKYANLDQYYKNFLRGNIYRDNCYNCDYAKKERISDITIGDFWGLEHSSKIYDNESNGISAVMPLSEKGLKLIEETLPLFVYEEREYEEVFNHNEQLNNPMKRKQQYYIFKKNYLLKGYKKTFKKMNKLKDYIKYNSLIYNLYKKGNR